MSLTVGIAFDGTVDCGESNNKTRSYSYNCYEEKKAILADMYLRDL